MTQADATATLHFLPWLRSGATTAIDAPDPLEGPLIADPVVSPWVRVGGHDVSQDAHLRGPGHVIGLGAQTIGRLEPPDNTRDFEPNYFPFAEVRPADLPWRYSPASAGVNAQLRPWLVLVAIRQQDGVSIVSEPDAPLPVLRLEAPAVPSRELPDLADSAAWAHVQSRVAPNAVAAAVVDDPDVALARLICPRRLLPNENWLACLVPAFDVGVKAGLGESVAGLAETSAAWDLTSSALDQNVVRLPVYASWAFSTAADGDFEALARRLMPDEGAAVLGRASIDVTNPGPPLPEPTTAGSVLGDFVGALKSPGVRGGDLPADHGAWLEAKLEPLLEHGADRLTVPAVAPVDYRPRRDDPVIAPPLYGSFQANRFDVPVSDDAKRAWMRPLNLDPQLRAIAGLGARVVRANQEALVASAWAQAGAIRETTAVLVRGQLATETARALARKVTGWDAGSVVQASRPLHAWTTSPVSSATLAGDLARSAVPRGLIGAAFARATRKQTALARTWTRHPPSSDERDAATAATTAFLEATSPRASADLRGALAFAETTLAEGAWTHDGALDGDVPSVVSGVPDTVSLAPSLVAAATRFGSLERAGTRFDGSLTSAIAIAKALRPEPSGARARPGAVPSAPVIDLSGAASAVRTSLDPRPPIEAGIALRVASLATCNADGALPRRLDLAPVFTDPLCWDLVRLDSQYLLPGADQLEDNRVALLAVDDDFVAAFLVGANHEMARELVWREYPCSTSATFFHRFWDASGDASDDIGDISDWTRPTLRGNVTGVSAGTLAVVLIRGDLVLRYPEAHVYLCRGVWDGDAVLPDPTQIEEAVLQGAIDRKSVFYGFPVKAEDMRGDRANGDRTPATAGWFVAIEEPSLGPRFGLDAAATDGADLVTGAASWHDLTWGHLVRHGSTLDLVSQAVARAALPPRTPVALDGLTWGHNAAHMAAITWQRPFRLLIHADRLLPP